MSAVIANSHKLLKLPPKVQCMLKSLSEPQLKTLQAVLSNHNHFDFLGLPSELRNMIYLLVFQDGFHGGNIKCGKRYPVPGLQLLRCNEQICAEARGVLRGLAPFSVSREHFPLEAGGYLTASQKFGLAFFSNVSLTFFGVNNSVNWTDKRSGRPGRLLRAIVEEMAKGHDDASYPVTLRLQMRATYMADYEADNDMAFAWHGSEAFQAAGGKISTASRPWAIFGKAQFKTFFSNFRSYVALELSNASVVTKMMYGPEGVQCHQVNRKTIVFRDDMRHSMGSITLWGTDVYVHEMKYVANTKVTEKQLIPPLVKLVLNLGHRRGLF